MNSMQAVNPYSRETILSNLNVISSLKSGEKLVTDDRVGCVSKENRWALITARRGYWKAFSLEVIERTFSQALDLIKVEAMMRPLDQVVWKELIPGALSGLKVLQETYAKEGKDRGLKKLYEDYLGKFNAFALPMHPAKNPFGSPDPFCSDPKMSQREISLKNSFNAFEAVPLDDTLPVTEPLELMLNISKEELYRKFPLNVLAAERKTEEVVVGLDAVGNWLGAFFDELLGEEDQATS